MNYLPACGVEEVLTARNPGACLRMCSLKPHSWAQSTLFLNCTVTALHAMETLLRDASNPWMSNAIWLSTKPFFLIRTDWSLIINPAILPPDDVREEATHDCLETLDIMQGIQPDLTDVPFTTRDVNLCMDDSSFFKKEPGIWGNTKDFFYFPIHLIFFKKNQMLLLEQNHVVFVFRFFFFQN